MKTQNPVAKHLRQFNKAVTHKDRKKASKRGYQKHKSRQSGICRYWDAIKIGYRASTKKISMLLI